jgi:hypothetical protein
MSTGRIINLQALTAEAFGLAAARVLTEHPGPLGPKDRQTVQRAVPEQHGGAGLGLLGLPAFCRVSFLPVRTNAGLFEGLELIDPILTVSQPQNLIITPITGRRSAVIEYIGQGNYAVTIRGILATDPFSANRFEYPLQQVQAMRDMIALGIAMPVSGWLLDVYGIKNLVFQNATYEALPGFTNLQAYELQCLSDEPIELSL